MAAPLNGLEIKKKYYVDCSRESRWRNTLRRQLDNDFSGAARQRCQSQNLPSTVDQLASFRLARPLASNGVADLEASTARMIENATHIGMVIDGQHGTIPQAGQRFREQLVLLETELHSVAFDLPIGRIAEE
jgi:hypothetical protein